MARHKRNPSDPRKWLKGGLIIAAGYGVLSAYKQIRGGGDGDTRTPRQKCAEGGGVWEPYPTFIPDETGTAGYCRKPGVQT